METNTDTDRNERNEMKNTCQTSVSLLRVCGNATKNDEDICSSHKAWATKIARREARWEAEKAASNGGTK